jgi:hypothetical protein
MDAGAKKKIGKLSFYGPGGLMGFSWNPIDHLTFIITFRAIPRKDRFEASCEWSDLGKLPREYSEIRDEELFLAETFNRQHGKALLQSLTQAQRGQEGYRYFSSWDFWTPSASLDDSEAWFREFYHDELRDIPDEEARTRVEGAVTLAMSDIKRCAMPWLETKLAHYRNTRN